MISSRFKTRTQSGYSLVELLAVMAIMALLAAVSLPAIRGLSNADNLSTKLGMVSNMLTQARSQAIRLRTPVQLRVVTDLWQLGGGGNDTTACYRKMSLWKLQQDDPTNSGNPAWTPTWVQLTTWETLGPAIVFEMAQDPTTLAYTFTAANNPTTAGYTYFLNPAYTAQTLTTASGPAVVTPPGQALGSITADWVALEFLPTGGLNVGSGNANIYLLLAPGSYNGTGMAYTQKTLADWGQIRISSLTGITSIVRP